jgi:hypothetical protein
VQSVHDFLNARGKIPSVHIENVNVSGTELLEGCFNRDMKGLHAISGVVDLNRDGFSAFEVGRVLSLWWWDEIRPAWDAIRPQKEM